MKPQLSVIIPTYNEAEHISECINSLLKQTTNSFEIIIVDDGSKDSTIKIVNHLKSQGQKTVPIKVLSQNHQGPGHARNLGSKHANGNILVFVDADMTFDKNFLKHLTQPIIKGETNGTFSSSERVANWDNPIARSWSLIRGFEEGRMHPKNYPNKQRVFRSILKSEFDKVSGFDPKRGYDDDWSLSEKLGYLADNSPQAQFYHFNPSKLTEIFMQSRWLAKRVYKLGIIGKLFNLLKTLFPISLLKGLWLLPKHKTFWVVPVTISSDFGIFIGILESIITQKKSK